MVPQDSRKDPEKATRDKFASPGGYDRLAVFMGSVPDAAIFHRFSHLSIESLLHYQAELCDLNVALRRLQKEDRESGDNTGRATYAFKSQNLQASEGAKGDGRTSMQWKTIERIRDVLKDYYSALTLHHQIATLNKPHSSHLDELRVYMHRPSMGNMYLYGNDRGIWKDSSVDELLTLEPTTQDGTTSSRSSASIVKLYHNILGRFLHNAGTEDHLQNTIVYRRGGVAQIVRVCKALVASMLPVVSVVILYLVEDTKARLGLIAGFTAGFSLTLCYFTSASIKDVFSATAAFSAVLVVFIGTTNSS